MIGWKVGKLFQVLALCKKKKKMFLWRGMLLYMTRKFYSYILLAATSSSRNTPWLLLLLFLWVMMMLPLIINSYNLVTFNQNLMKLVLNWRITHCLSFPGIIFLFFPFFSGKIWFYCVCGFRKISALIT